MARSGRLFDSTVDVACKRFGLRVQNRSHHSRQLSSKPVEGRSSMTKIKGALGASDALRSPPGHEPIRILLRAGKNDEAIGRLDAIISSRPTDSVAKHLLFDAHFQNRNWRAAL